VNTDAAPPPTPSLRRLHRRPAVSIVATPFSLRRSRISFLSVGAPSSRRFPSASRRRFPMNGASSRHASENQEPWLLQAAHTGRTRSGRTSGCSAGRTEGHPAPRRRALRQARDAPQVRCLGRGAILVCATGSTRWRSQRTPAPRPGRAYPLLPVFVRKPGCPVCRDPDHAAPCLGEPPRWRVSICVEPAFEPRTLFCRCLCA
jgi:hypothetical protein